MIRHVVAFGIKAADGLNKMEQAERIKGLLLTLPEKISFLKRMEVGINLPQAPEENAELLLICDFDSIEDCAMYQIHPAHVEVSKEIGKVKTSRACVDYEI